MSDPLVSPAPESSPALAVENLDVDYAVPGGVLHALAGVSFRVEAGERMAVVGESGSGKSTLGLALMGLLPKSARVSATSVEIAGGSLDLTDERSLRRHRGRSIAMVFQDAKAALDPVRTVGYQIAEPLRVHGVVPTATIPTEITGLLRQVEIPHPELRSGQYPHELSGGMRQRVMLATALAGRPDVLVADEPTSALDVTTQATVIDLMRRLGESNGMTTLLITHDLGLVAGFADTIMVLYAGRVVEYGPVVEVYARPRHPYTRALLASVPSIKDARRRQLGSIPGTLPDLRLLPVGCAFQPRCPRGRDEEICRRVDPPVVESAGVTARCHFVGERPSVATPLTEEDHTLAEPTSVGAEILQMRQIRKTFHRTGFLRRRGVVVQAVAGVDLMVHAGESVGIVGESGSGKTTLARVVVGLETATAGEILISESGGRRLVKVLPRQFAQMVFQDPGDSLDPRMSVAEIISEPLVLHGGGTWRRYRDAVSALLLDVGLRADMADRRPSQLSGGQRQRIAIARALSTKPQLIVADEAVASLDMSARGQILNLLARLQAEHGFAYLHISHDLSMVRHVCDRVAVMFAGHVVETAPAEQLFADPQHPYTQALIAAVPVPIPGAARARELTIPADLPEIAGEGGCVYRTRCPIAQDRCAVEDPILVAREAGGRVDKAAPVDRQMHATACLFRGAGDGAA